MYMTGGCCAHRRQRFVSPPGTPTSVRGESRIIYNARPACMHCVLAQSDVYALFAPHAETRGRIFVRLEHF